MHPVKDAERLKEAALGKVRMPDFFFVAFESLSLNLYPSGWDLGC